MIKDSGERTTMPEPPVSISQEDAVCDFFEHEPEEGECYD